MTKKMDYKKEFNKYKNKAQELIKNNEKLEELLLSAEERLKAIPNVGKVLSYIPVFIDMVKSYLSGEYKEIPTGTLISICAVLIYFASPIDLIPDFIPVLGLVDDAGVMLAGLALVKSDLDIYINWRKHKPIDVTAKVKKTGKKEIKKISSKTKKEDAKVKTVKKKKTKKENKKA